MSPLDVDRRMMMAQALVPGMQAAAGHGGLASVVFGALGGHMQRRAMEAQEAYVKQQEQQEQERRRMIAEAVMSGNVREAAAMTGDPSLIRMALEQKKEGPLQVGGHLVDPSSFQTLWSPPEKPQQSKVGQKIAEAEAALGRKLTEAERMKLAGVAPAQGQSISITLPGNQELTTANQNKTQARVQGLLDTIASTEDIADDYADRFLGAGNRAAGKLEELRDSAATIPGLGGLGLDEAGKANLADRTKFQTKVEQLFNQYRKEITGAAASEKELQMLRTALFNTDMTPTQFKAAFGQFVQDMKEQLGRSQGQLAEGLPVVQRISTDEEYDALPSGAQFIDPDGNLRRKP